MKGILAGPFSRVADDPGFANRPKSRRIFGSPPIRSRFTAATASATSPASATCSRDTSQPTGLARGAGGSPRGRTPASSSRFPHVSSSTGAPISCPGRGSIGIGQPKAGVGGRAKPRLWLPPPEAAGAMDGPAAVKQARGVRPESQAQVRRPTGDSSCRSKTTGRSFRHRPTNCP